MKSCFEKSISVLLAILCAFNFAVVSFAEEAVMSGVCGENAEWVYDEESATLTVSGTGEIEDRYNGWESFRKKVKTLKVCEGITRIGVEVFDQFTALVEVSLPESLEIIGKHTFYYCVSLKHIRIPTGVRRIEVSAFELCKSLESVAILGDSCSLGTDAFRYCTVLSEVYVSDEVISVGMYTFEGTAFYDDPSNWENDVLYVGKNLIKAKNTLSGEYVIKEGTKSISGGAFRGCSELENVIIPEGITMISYEAFKDCTKLANVSLPVGLKKISDYAFENCTKLTDVNFPVSLKEISREAFKNCSELTSAEFAEGLEFIGFEAFWGCNALETIVVPDSCYRIETRAFSGTAYFNNDSNWEDGVLYIGKHVCVADWGIKGECTIKEGTISISEGAFVGCNKLTKIKIPYGLLYIGLCAFSGCTSLREITLPASVKEIGGDAFVSTEVKTVNFIGTEEDWAEISIAGANDPLYNNIVFNYGLNGACGEYTTWNFDTKSETLTISGTGTISDYSGWNDIAHAVTYVEIENGITSVEENAFSGFGALEEVYMAESVTELGDDAFKDCSKLAIVTALSDDLSFNNAFSGNDSRFFFVAKAESETYNALKSAGFTVNGISTDKEKDGHQVLSFDGKTTIYQNLDYNYISNLIADNSDAYYLYFDKITFEGIAPDTIVIDTENLDGAEKYFTLNEVYISVSVNGKTVSLPELVQLLQQEDADGIISFEEEEGKTFFEMLSDFFEETVGEFVTEAFKVIKTVINAIRKLFK